MASSRNPGSSGRDGSIPNIRDGTLCRDKSPRPGSLRGAHHKHPLTHSVAHSESSVSALLTPAYEKAEKRAQEVHRRLASTQNWPQLKRLVELTFRQNSFNLGVAYGLAEHSAHDAVGLFVLIKTFFLAYLYERSEHPLLVGFDPADTLIAIALRQFPGTAAEMKRAHDQVGGMLTELRQIMKDPLGFAKSFGANIKESAIKDWERFHDLSKQTSLASQFEAGKIAGEVLYEVIMAILMVISVAGTAAKIASRFPKLIEAIRGLKLGGNLEEAAAADSVLPQQKPKSPVRPEMGESSVPLKPLSPRGYRRVRIPPEQAEQELGSFLKQYPNIKDENLQSHFDAAELDRSPVFKTTLDPGARFDMWVRDDGKPGMYATVPGTDPHTIGIDPDAPPRHLETYTVTQKMQVIETTASDYENGELSTKGIGGSGGGSQMVLPPGWQGSVQKVTE